MFVLFFIYRYIAVCMFSAVRCGIITCLSLLLYNYVLQYCFYISFLALYASFLICVLELFRTLYLLLYTAASFLYLC
jgi:hypothetical protein